MAIVVQRMFSLSMRTAMWSSASLTSVPIRASARARENSLDAGSGASLATASSACSRLKPEPRDVATSISTSGSDVLELLGPALGQPAEDEGGPEQAHEPGR